MKMISTLAAGAALSAMVATGALASDLNGGSLKDSGGNFANPVVNWTGLYIGGSIGYGNAKHDLSLHDYFKDFCADKIMAARPDFDPFNRRKRKHTVENHNNDHLGSGDANDPTDEYFRTSCEARTGRADGGDVDTLPDNTVTDDVTIPGDSREIGNLNGVNSAGLVGDGRIGFDVQRGRFVFGVFGAYGFNDMEADGKGALSGLGDFSLEKGQEWSAGARAGILVNPRTLAYIMAAYTQTDYDLTIHGEGGSSHETTFDGVTVGGGVEFAVTNNVFLGIEGSHTFYGKETIFDEYDAERNEGTRLDDKLGETKVMGTLKIKLNSGLGNVID